MTLIQSLPLGWFYQQDSLLDPAGFADQYLARIDSAIGESLAEPNTKFANFDPSAKLASSAK
jgi:hypothetical protein